MKRKRSARVENLHEKIKTLEVQITGIETVTARLRLLAELMQSLHFVLDDLSIISNSLESALKLLDKRKNQIESWELDKDLIRKDDRRIASASRPNQPLSKTSRDRGSRGPKPKGVVTEWRHAEELARNFLHWLGFTDAKLTGDGADGGMDVASKRAVAQVKMHSKGVPRYDFQKLVGINSLVIALYFLPCPIPRGPSPGQSNTTLHSSSLPELAKSPP